MKSYRYKNKHRKGSKQIFQTKSTIKVSINEYVCVKYLKCIFVKFMEIKNNNEYVKILYTFEYALYNQ